ncbi:MAG TPA: ABC transporter ATP-binding protein [Verrucomicrobiae bacterium]|nr:ABC transporter ATP-binding protein [Verrucomicrobiae bacterium]
MEQSVGVNSWRALVRAARVDADASFQDASSNQSKFTVDNALILSRGLTRRYNVGRTVVVALANISLEITRGEFTALVGPSGSGKSTLLNLIGGLDRPSDGEIRVDGLSLGPATEQQLVHHRRERVGFIFQSFNLLPTFNAVENVESPMVLAEVPHSERRARATTLLESVGLAQRLYHRPNELSGGEKQRVAIARALVNRPPLLLADEPTGNLDTKTGAAILDLLCGLVKQSGLTLVMVTHDLEVASRADRTIHLRDGSIQHVEARQKPGAST